MLTKTIKPNFKCKYLSALSFAVSFCNMKFIRPIYSVFLFLNIPNIYYGNFMSLFLYVMYLLLTSSSQLLKLKNKNNN